MNAPAVSVLVTSYDHERWIGEALDSLIAQTFDDFEVIITDDCSNDNTVAVIKDWLRDTGFPAKLIVNERNVGIAAVRNAALSIARGEYVCSLSGDDRYRTQRLELQHDAISQSPDHVAGIFSDMCMINADGAEIGWTWLEERGVLPPPSGPQLFRRLLLSSFLPAPAMMVKRAALTSVGPYDDTLVFEDYDMWLRLSDRYELQFYDAVLVDYRVHPNNLSRRPDREFEFIVDVGRVQSKWRGRYPDVDWANARHMWAHGRRIVAENGTVGQRILGIADDLVPTPSGALALELDWANQSEAREYEAELQQLHGDMDKLVERFHLSESRTLELTDQAQRMHRELQEMEKRYQVSRAAQQQAADAVAHLLDSRWLALLKTLEWPVRRFRPGLGSVTHRLRQLHQQLKGPKL